MAEGLWLVERTTALDGNDIDGVRTMILADDDGTSSADILVAAVTAINAASGATGKFPTGYFDSTNLLSDLVTVGDLRTDSDFIAMGEIHYSVRT
jgi:hypothetical protein